MLNLSSVDHNMATWILPNPTTLNEDDEAENMTPACSNHGYLTAPATCATDLHGMLVRELTAYKKKA